MLPADGLGNLTQAQLVAGYATNKTRIDPQTNLVDPRWGRLAPEDAPKVASAFKLGWMQMSGASLTPAFIVDKMSKGHILLIFNSETGNSAHALVVYGVGQPEQAAFVEVSFMDPGNPPTIGTGIGSTDGALRNEGIGLFKSRALGVMWVI